MWNFIYLLQKLILQAGCCGTHLGGKGRWISLSWRPAWSTKQVPGQPGICSETLPQRENFNLCMCMINVHACIHVPVVCVCVYVYTHAHACAGVHACIGPKSMLECFKVSIAVIKTNQKPLGQERVYFSLQFPITVHHCGKSQQELRQGRNLEAGTDAEAMEGGVCLLACPWLAHGLPMACPWLAHGLPMACPWLAHGLLMACSWLAHGLLSLLSYSTQDFPGVALSTLSRALPYPSSIKRMHLRPNQKPVWEKHFLLGIPFPNDSSLCQGDITVASTLFFPFFNKSGDGQWWRKPLIPALGRQRQADF
jgi:hypothetical protein